MVDAEDVLADAWVQVLIELRDQSQTKARSAEVRCERAQRVLDAAHVRRDPGPIAAAHADLEQTLLAGGGQGGRPADPPPAPAPPPLLVRLSRRVMPWASTIAASFAAAGHQK